MVNTEIPKHYTASPSSHAGTPHLTINREATYDLDSSNSFEGPEKLLEVWFAPTATALPAQAGPLGLKKVTAAEWTEMLDLVHCKVLSIVESDQVDAYLLSESSMFVFPHKLVLKTCGITTLISGLPRMLEIAALSAGFPHTPVNLLAGTPAAATPYRIFYSRKNYLYPDQQRGPHRSWRDEVRALDRLFCGGSAYMIGKMNGEHWYLYLTEPDTRLTPPATPEHERVGAPHETQTKILHVPEHFAGMDKQFAYGMDADADDETLEVLMTDLDEANAKQFYLDHASAVAEGEYYQTYRPAQDALASIGEDSGPDDGVTTHCGNNNDSFDVFEQTCSDHSTLSSDDETPPFPEELTTEGHALGTVVSKTCGLSDVYPLSKYPDARIDAYLFTPCGFSANGVIPAPAPLSNSKSAAAAAAAAAGGGKEGGGATHYFTVHVTPEKQCSYASFETNVPAKQTGRETAEIVEQVVNIFKPGRFSVTLFEAKRASCGTGTGNGAGTGVNGDVNVNGNGNVATVGAKEGTGQRMDSIAGYRRVDRIVHDLNGYELVFRYYERFDWKGGAPRLGGDY